MSLPGPRLSCTVAKIHSCQPKASEAELSTYMRRLGFRVPLSSVYFSFMRLAAGSQGIACLRKPKWKPSPGENSNQLL